MRFAVLVLCTQVNMMFVMLLMLCFECVSHRASLKNMPGHGGNRTYDLWNTSQGLKFDFFLSIHMDTKVLKFDIPPDNPVSQIWILN
jgi:hypothetical protein